MNPFWRSFLQSEGAVVDGGTATNFGRPEDELKATVEDSVLCDLSHFGIIDFSGHDAADFLQGQLSNDVRRLASGISQYGSYNTPKGRVLASFLLWCSARAFHMQLPLELLEAIKKRLSMFILRAKLTASTGSDEMVRIGVAGAMAEPQLMRIFGSVPEGTRRVLQKPQASIIRLGPTRFEVAALIEHAPRRWHQLASGAQPVGAACWDWLEIAAGIPVIGPQTQDMFVPQMINLDLIGGISFDKGCYPGQEIVARTKYLGKLKRRMYRANVRAETAPKAGDELHSAAFPGQASGTIVNSAPSPVGGYDVLAVIQISSVGTAVLHLGSADGPTLDLRYMPYSVPSETSVTS